MFIQQQEAQDYEAAYNPADRFIGFDRGDAGHDCDNDVSVVCIGRMTNGAGQRVEIIESCSGEFVEHSVLIDGDMVFSEEDNRARAITVARWWMSGCQA